MIFCYLPEIFANPGGISGDLHMVIVTKCPENLFPQEMTWFTQKLALDSGTGAFFHNLFLWITGGSFPG